MGVSFSGDRHISDGIEVSPLMEGHELPPPVEQELFCARDTGYRGFWHGQTPTDDEYAFKYSGGLGTYCAKHSPFSVYAPEVNKTFFCWGGTPKDSHLFRAGREHSADTLFEPGLLHHMVSWYDHETGEVPRPVVLLDKWCGDAHDNPVISIDSGGHIWIFSSSHGSWTTPSYIHRSTEPWRIDQFQTIREDLFSYPQVHAVPNGGFTMFHTLYTNLGRTACFRQLTLDGGQRPLVVLAHIGQGHYQVSAVSDTTAATAFNYHPAEGGLEARTNLYYMESHDGGKSWVGPDYSPVNPPVRDIVNDALLKNYADEGWLVYMKDMQFDSEGNPVILYIRSRGNLPGLQNGPRIWSLAKRSKSGEWSFSDITTSDCNYDMGSLFLNDRWVLLAPTEPGPQPGNPGGEVAKWVSGDGGNTWLRERMLTGNSERNHTYVRRTHGYAENFAAFWADGNPRTPSESYLYFSNRDGTSVRQLPAHMSGELEKPRQIIA